MGPTDPAYSVEDLKEDYFHRSGKALDLTRQVVPIHHLSQPSKMSLDKSTREPYLCQKATSILASAKRDGKAGFITPVMPKMKLVSSKLVECRSLKSGSIFFCGSCSLKLAEKDVISHVSALNHQKMHRVVLNLNEKSYSNISKQSFQSALHTLKALHLRPYRVRKSSPSSAPDCAKPANASVTLHSQHANSLMDDKVVNVELESAEDSGTVAVMATTFKTARVFPASNAEQMMTRPRISRRADNFRACLSAGTTVTQTLKRNFSTKETKGAHLPPYSRRNGTGTHFAGNAICKVKSLPLKSSEVASISSVAPSKCTTSFKLTKTATSTAVVSNSISALKSATVPRPLRGRTEVVSKAKSPCKAFPFSQVGSTVVQEATCRTAPSCKGEHASRYSQTASKGLVTPHTNRTFMATVKTPELSMKRKNTGASAKTVHVVANPNVAPHALKRTPPAAPHPNAVMPALTEHTKPHKEPSPVSASKAQQSNRPKVGLNQLIVVSWEGKRQVYCQLCSVRLKRSNHSTSFHHHYNYVKMKYPGWSAQPAELESKLNNIVARLADVEKNVGSQNAQKVEVNKDMYLKLAVLPEDEAVDKVKAMVRQNNQQVTSSTLNTEEPLRREVGSPCEVSCSDDGVRVPYEMSGIFVYDQRNKNLHHAPLVQIPERRSDVKGKSNLAGSQSVEGLEYDGGAETGTDSDPQLLPFISLDKNHLEPIPDHGTQTEDVAEIVQQEQLEPVSEVQSPVEVTHVIENPGVKVGKARRCLVKLVDSRQQRYSDPHTKDPQKEVESRRTLLPVEVYSPELRAATLNTGQENQQGLSHKAEQAPKHGPVPGGHSTSQQQTRISVGGRAQGCSHLSIYLKASQQYDKPVIGMGSIWECRGMSLKTFFLCESCEETLSRHDICQHMGNLDHQLKYMRRSYPKFLQIFCQEDDLLSQGQMHIFNDVILELSMQEQFHKVDAQCVLLGQELHDFVRTAPFSEALQMVKNIKNEGKPSVFYLPISTTCQKSQQPKDWQGSPPDPISAQAFETEQRCHSGQQSLKDSFPLERLLGPAILPNQRSGSETAHENGKSKLGKRAKVGDLDHLKDGDLNHRVASYHSRTGPKVAPFLKVGTDHALEETYSFSSQQPEFTPPMSRLRKSISLLKVKREEVSSEMASFGPSLRQNLDASFKDECPPTRKRPPDTPVELLLETCTSSPLETKCVLSPQQVKSELSSQSTSESISLSPAANLALQSLKGGDATPSHLPHTVDGKCMEKLVSAEETGSVSRNLSPSTNNFYDTSLSHPVESRWDSKIQEIKSETAVCI